MVKFDDEKDQRLADLLLSKGVREEDFKYYGIYRNDWEWFNHDGYSPKPIIMIFVLIVALVLIGIFVGGHK